MALANKTIDIQISKGARLYKKYLWNDSDGNPINLTGKKARVQVRESDMSATVLMTMSTEAGESPEGVITLGNGTIEFYVPGTTTETLTWEKGIYDLKIYTTADDADEIFEGIMTVEAGATSVQ